MRPVQRLKIVNGSSIRIHVAIPADVVKRMVAKKYGMQKTMFCHPYLKLSLFIVRDKLRRRTNISFTERRVFQKLTGRIGVALGVMNFRERFNDQESGGLAFIPQSVRNRPWNVDIATFSEFYCSKSALQLTFAVMYEDQLICHSVSIVIVHRFARSADGQAHIGISHRVSPGFQPGPRRCNVESSDMNVPKRDSLAVFGSKWNRFPDPVYQSW